MLFRGELGTRHLPERLSFLRCFLGHGEKDLSPPAHLVLKNKLRQCMRLWTLQSHSTSVTLIANTPSKVDGAASGTEPRRTRATCMMLCWLHAYSCQLGGCQQAKVHANHWSQQPCHDRNGSCLLKPPGRATFAQWEEPGAGEQRGSGSPLMGTRKGDFFWPSLWRGGAQELITVLPTVCLHNCNSRQSLAHNLYKVINGSEACSVLCS